MRRFFIDSSTCDISVDEPSDWINLFRPMGQIKTLIQMNTDDVIEGEENVSELGPIRRNDDDRDWDGLLSLPSKVIPVMKQITELDNYDLDLLNQIPLRFVRRNATRMWGYCAYKRGSQRPMNPSKVRSIGIHPKLLHTSHLSVAMHTLYHEYLHALGYHRHDKRFRYLESLWPLLKGENMLKAFTSAAKYVREKNSWKP
tara:strand:- start:6 stop:605 length:600 start_codon:yes stop_codon:yes gene_type:complete